MKIIGLAFMLHPEGAQRPVELQNICSLAGGDSVPCFMAFQEMGKSIFLILHIISHHQSVNITL